MSSAQRALLIWNPAAGRGRPVAPLAEALIDQGWQVDTAITDSAGAGTAARRGVAEKYSTLIACGGDGTINEIVQVLALTPARRRPCLGVVPWGTANTMACALGVPMRPDAAARWLARSQPRAVPLGEIRRPEQAVRFFLAVASVGFDAAVVHALAEQSPGNPAAPRPEALPHWTGPSKRQWGTLAYAWAALTGWPNYFPAPMQFQLRPETETGASRPEADGLIVGLTPFYGGRLRLGSVDADGAIRLVLRGDPAMLAPQAFCLATGGLEFAPGVERLPRAVIDVTTPGLPVELDGEPAGHTPVQIAVRPEAIEIIGQ